MLLYLVELGPRRRRDPAAVAVAAKVARSFARRPRGREKDDERDDALRELARRRLGLIRDRRAG